MSTESTIVMRARDALKSNKEIEVPEDITVIQFKFMRGSTCYSIEEWFDFCVQNGVPDITERFKDNLKGLKKLARKIGYEYFERSFEMAYKLLDNSATPNHENIPQYIYLDNSKTKSE